MDIAKTQNTNHLFFTGKGGTPDQACIDKMSKLLEDTTNTTTHKVMNIFGGIMGFSTLPELKWQSRFSGPTFYLSGIEAKDLDFPIMRGMDEWGRPFLAFRVKYTLGRDEEPKAFTIFQRYRDNLEEWTSGERKMSSFVSSRVHEEELSRLRHLVLTGRSFIWVTEPYLPDPIELV